MLTTAGTDFTVAARSPVRTLLDQRIAVDRHFHRRQRVRRSSTSDGMIWPVEPKIIRRMNARMERLLPTLGPGAVPADVEAALRSGVAELGPYLLLRCEAERLTAPPKPVPDATGVEASLNHVHPDQHAWTVQECAEAAITALDILRQEIVECHSSGPVQVVLSVGFHEIPSSSLRFYRRRPGEPWITDDLESYETEAILVEEIR